MALELKPIRVLEPGDEPLVEAFCARYPDTTLFFRNNLQRAGIVDNGERYQGTYTAFINSGRIEALAGHFWNGMLILEAPTMLQGVATDAVWKSGRPVKGLIGRQDQVVDARALFGLQQAAATMDSKEILFALDLDGLRVPGALDNGNLAYRRATPDDRSKLVEWSVAYHVEAIGETDRPELWTQCEVGVTSGTKNKTIWVLEDGGELVSMTRFNATAPEAVQVGGVYTPPELRSKGYGAAVVAGSLLDAKKDGVKRSILFTNVENTPAIRCYEGLGYDVIGDYGLVIFEDAHRMTL